MESWTFTDAVIGYTERPTSDSRILANHDWPLMNTDTLPVRLPSRGLGGRITAVRRDGDTLLATGMIDNLVARDLIILDGYVLELDVTGITGTQLIDSETGRFIEGSIEDVLWFTFVHQRFLGPWRVAAVTLGKHPAWPGLPAPKLVSREV